MKKPDPALDDLRRVRSCISKVFDHDPHRMVRHYMKLQEQYADRMLKPSGPADLMHEGEGDDPCPNRR